MAGANQVGTPAAEAVLEVAASREEATGSAGIGWRLSGPTGPPLVRTQTLRVGRSLVHAELVAVRSGVNEARRRGWTRLRIRVPSTLTAQLLQGGVPTRARRAAEEATRLRTVWAAFDRVVVEVNTHPDSELSQAVGEALDAGLHAAAEREEHRELVMERIVERSKDVRLERRNGGWVANDRYRVSLDPLSCECPAWTTRWAKAPIAGRRAQRLLCKHLVALAFQEGIREPEALAMLARRAPP